MRHSITKYEVLIVVFLCSIFLNIWFYLDKYPDENENKENEQDKSPEEKSFKIFRDVRDFIVGKELVPEDAYQHSKHRLFQNIEKIVDKGNTSSLGSFTIISQPISWNCCGVKIAGSGDYGTY